MAKIYEEISKSNANSGGKTDSNLANDANHLGGIPAEQYATQKYVQDYHNNKESAQKEYIDQQDQKVLEEAKEYTNSQIRGQDFSGFAKVTDVQALDKKISEELTSGLTTQKNYTDQEIKKVVKDANINFTDVNNAINTLNANQNNLFQSVSNGKSKIAGAITDKGVTTSASDSFDTMARNIRNIQSGSGSGGEIDPNFVNTSDATAFAEDILLGKTAYSQGNKIYGTYIPSEGGSGSVEYPVYGTDTSGATAVASDIAYGKTAFARGQLITGTAIFGGQNGGVEEIYGASKDPYEINKTNYVMSNNPDGLSKVKGIHMTRFSLDGNFCARVITAEDGNYYIESFAVDNAGFYFQASTNLEGTTVYKKYRYTFEELGLTDDDGNLSSSILDMSFGKNGFGGEDDKCILAILYQVGSSDTKKVYVKLLTYHLKDNGVIGQAYSNESTLIDYKIKVSIYYCKICYNPVNPLEFYLLHYSVYYETGLTRMRVIVSASSGNAKYSTLFYNGALASGRLNWHPSRIKASIDGRYVVCYCDNGSSDTLDMIFSTDEDTPSKYTILPTYGTTSYLEQLDKVIICNIESSNKINSYLYGISRDAGVPILTLEKTININVPGIESAYDTYCEAYATKDNSKLILTVVYRPKSDTSGLTNCSINVLDLQAILSAEDGDESLEIIQSYPIADTYTNRSLYTIDGNLNDTRIQVHQDVPDGDSYNKVFSYTLVNSLDEENIIGLIYKNQYYGRLNAHLLSAGQPDVRAGKTFIGWMGYPEEGTMEV